MYFFYAFAVGWFGRMLLLLFTHSCMIKSIVLNSKSIFLRVKNGLLQKVITLND